MFAVTKAQVEFLAEKINNYFSSKHHLKKKIAVVNHSGGEIKGRAGRLNITSSTEAKVNFNAWMDGKYPILVATSSCGLGLDKKNLSLVIHYGLPLNLTDYQQQIGRAGRGHQHAMCGESLTFFS